MTEVNSSSNNNSTSNLVRIKKISKKSKWKLSKVNRWCENETNNKVIDLLIIHSYCISRAHFFSNEILIIEQNWILNLNRHLGHLY
jgi:hypothetical protein